MLAKWPLYRIIISASGVVIGALGGYAYWYYIGCYSGTCPITSKASNSSLYGAVMGFLIAGTIWDLISKRTAKHKEK